MSSRRIAVCLMLLAAACGREGVDGRLIAEAADGERAPEGCGATAGARDDLAAEPAAWLEAAEYIRWQDVDGCPIRVDVVAHSRGSERCNWEDVDFLTIGVPIGASIDGAEEARTYFWDPTGALDQVPIGAGSESIESLYLPESAIDTGLRLDGKELWYDELDPTVLFHVGGDRAEVWQLDQFEQLTCS